MQKHRAWIHISWFLEWSSLLLHAHLKSDLRQDYVSCETKIGIFFFNLIAFDCVDHNKLWKILQEMEYQTTWSASSEICMQVKKQQLELDMEQQTGSK